MLDQILMNSKNLETLTIKTSTQEEIEEIGNSSAIIKQGAPSYSPKEIKWELGITIADIKMLGSILQSSTRLVSFTFLENFDP